MFYLGTYYTGVSSVRVALLAEKADVEYDPETMDPDTLVTEIKGLGFGAQLIGDAQGPNEGEVDLMVRKAYMYTISSMTLFFFFGMTINIA